MSDSIEAVIRTTISAHRNKKSKKVLHGRIDVRRQDLAFLIGKRIKIIVCTEETEVRKRLEVMK